MTTSGRRPNSIKRRLQTDAGNSQSQPTGRQVTKAPKNNKVGRQKGAH